MLVPRAKSGGDPSHLVLEDEAHEQGVRGVEIVAHVGRELAERADGREPLGRVVTAYGRSHWDQPQDDALRQRLSTPDHVAEVLRAGAREVNVQHRDVERSQ